MDVKLRYKILIPGLLLASVFLWGRCSGKKAVTLSGPLPANVSEIVSVKNGVVTIQTSSHTKSISGVREGILTVMKDGTSKLDIRTHGWEHQVGMNGFINADGGALGIDLRGFYYKNFDAMLGIGYAPKAQRLDLWVGIGYTPHTTWMSNTTGFIGYSIRNNPIAGISVRF